MVFVDVFLMKTKTGRCSYVLFFTAKRLLVVYQKPTGISPSMIFFLQELILWEGRGEKCCGTNDRNVHESINDLYAFLQP